ncbi:phage holin family protein [Dysgonomonas sp. 520]|uniref:phage holin family protein n=1 Tax=Dysgonomonas sp. 520 TaxID=2302931 RepID=UPI0013D3E086|nr:phage holin family protein [Dysgonomonas sp. 520]NDW09922.1 hypothetical protein [Dysgonomonas sp. 520]
MKNKQEENINLFGLYERIKADLHGYLQNKLKWLKLSTYEKLALAFGHLGFFIILGVFALSIFFLGVIAFGLFLGECLGSYAAGFGVMALVVVILLIVTMIVGKSLRKSLANLMVKIIHKVESNED